MLGDIEPISAQEFMRQMKEILKEERKNQTNEEWFTGLSTIEKAIVIVLCCPYEADWFGENFEKRMEQRMKNLSQSAYGYEKGIDKIKDWLKAVHRDD